MANVLKRMRLEIGLNPEALSNQLHRDKDYIKRVEACEQKVGLVDFHDICEALGKDSLEVFKIVSDELSEFMTKYSIT